MSLRSCTSTLVFALAASLARAGDLNPPPGPIAPTNRVQINAQALTLPYSIVNPGSYVLTSELSASGAGNGIEVLASNVTIDLNGFTLRGAGLGGHGIVALAPDVSVSNGTVTGWDHGLLFSSAASSRISHVRSANNAMSGIVLGNDSVVMDCIVDGNGIDGINAGGVRNRIERNHATNNGAVGYSIGGNDNVVVKNSAANNSTDYQIGPANAYGPIVAINGGDLAAVLNGGHPWANFGMLCPFWCLDQDSDTFGNPSATTQACNQPFGYVADCTDCDDTNPLVNTNMAELCDGDDNNCNGTTDEGNPGGGGNCNTGQVGICAAGTLVCSGGLLICQQNQLPTTETCDNLDNNCNGIVDEGNPGGGANCNTGLLGVCAFGTIVCNGGAFSCQQNQGSSAEVCDSLDNDCDGSTDEGCLANGSACTLNSQCSSGFCVDTVCCNNACASTCVACTAAKKGSGTDGTCGNIANGSDPDNECTGASTCNGAGVCNP